MLEEKDGIIRRRSSSRGETARIRKRDNVVCEGKANLGMRKR